MLNEKSFVWKDLCRSCKNINRKTDFIVLV